MVRLNPRRPLLLIVIAIAALAAGSLTARSGVEAWTTQYTGVSHGVSDPTGAATDIGRSIAIAADGSVYLAGFLQSDTITLGSLNVSTVEVREAFVAKFDAEGDPIWLRTYPAVNGVSIYDIEVTPAGDLFIAGVFASTMTFDTAPTPTTLSSAGEIDGFIARLDSSGAPTSAIAVGGTGSDSVDDLAYGPGDSITAVGTIVGDAIAPSAVTAPWPTTPANEDGVIINLSTTLGNVNWSARIGGTGDDRLEDVDVGSDGTIAVVGGADTLQTLSIVGAPSIPIQTIATPNPGSSSDMVVASLGTSGGAVSLNWSQIIAGTGADTADGVAIDDLGRVNVGGYGTGPFTVGGASHSSGRDADTDILLSQFAADGNPRWTRVIDSGNSRDEVRALALAPDGQILTVGRYGEPSGARFLAMAHSPDGDLIWGPILLGDAANQIAQAASVSPAGNVYLTGRFAGGPVDPTDASTTVTVNGGSDIMLFGFATQFPPSTTEATTTTADSTTTTTGVATSTTAPTTTTTGVATSTTAPTTTTTEAAPMTSPTTIATPPTDTAVLPSTGGDTTATTALFLLIASGALLTLLARRRV